MFNDVIVDLVRTYRNKDDYHPYISEQRLEMFCCGWDECTFPKHNGLTSDELQNLEILMSVTNDDDLYRSVFDLMVLIMDFCELHFDWDWEVFLGRLRTEFVENGKSYDSTDDLSKLETEKLYWIEHYGDDYLYNVLPYHLKYLRKKMSLLNEDLDRLSVLGKSTVTDVQ